jgi:hypothetical protein
MDVRTASLGNASESPPDVVDSRYDVLFLVLELSDSMRRGVHYFSRRGVRLRNLNAVLEALVGDGEVAYDDSAASSTIGH